MIGVLIFFGLVFFDLITKALADWSQVNTVIIPGVLHLDISYNRGMAFSFLADQPWARTFFLILTTIACIIFVILYFRLAKEKKLARLALVFITAGAVGNFVDRLGYGYVRDFLDIPFFANCNFADAFITAGAIMMLIYLLFVSEDALIPLRKRKKDE